MTRHISDCPKLPQNRDPWRGLERLEYEITLVTSMFGGGVTPGEADPVTLIRPPAIRGQLRFWWRATCGSRFNELDDLRRREIDVWGDTERPSRITVEVELRDKGKIEPWADRPPGKTYAQPRPGYPAYALFPFQNGERGVGNGVRDARFTLRFSFPSGLKADLQASIWAWINFGGIGARTRRGCGALWCPKLGLPDTCRRAVQNWLKESCAKQKSIVPTTKASWPKLGRYWIGPKSASPFEAWSEVIGLLHNFRQGVDTGRNCGTESDRPGRSRWPEAESIRLATGCRSRRHSPVRQIPSEAFPRAEFGMPIVFHFKDGPPKHFRGADRELSATDPGHTELHPVMHGEHKTRMASPLILKPLAVNQDLAFPLIVLLNVPRLSVVELVRGTEPIRTFPETSIHNPIFAAYPNSPLGAPGEGMPARSINGSAVEGFLALAAEKGYTEVEL